MDTRACVVCLLEQVFEVIREAEEEVARTDPAALGPVLRCLEHEARTRCCPLALARGSAVAKYGQGGVRTVAGVDVDSTVRYHGTAPRNGGSRPVEDAHDSILRDIRMCGRGCSTAETRVRDGNDLG